MLNKVFVDNNGIVEQIFEGDQASESVEEVTKETEAKLSDLRPGVLATLIKEYGGAEKYEVKAVSLTDQNVFSASTVRGQFVLIPKKGIDDFSGMQEFIAREIAGL